jgi:hypothetical protein
MRHAKRFDSLPTLVLYSYFLRTYEYEYPTQAIIRTRCRHIPPKAELGTWGL